ncbi:MAG: hypothetical protein N3F06_00195, partial [Nitrososphaerales archaeon]|nr:hypothetical protein [Nitrososphaerales archaeon]
MGIITQRDLTQNISRRYRLLFRLPSTLQAIFITLPTSLLILIMPKLIHHLNITVIFTSAITFTSLLFITIFIDRLLLLKSRLA